ncbi:MAG TPA: helix-turn-helix transcriptional regulator [Steroidobacteraceae bacterium]|nr:helix-turn-helix transcriptional regulator [Steroidobacteraceae bacterium]
MRRPESKFASPQAHSTAARLGSAIRAARLARKATQQELAERARMSAFTWQKIEKGDTSVAMGTWLSALEQTGLLGHLEQLGEPERDSLGQALRQQQLRVRGRRGNAQSSSDYDF